MAEKKKGTEVVEAQPAKTSLLTKFGKKYSVDPGKIYDTLLKTAFKEAKTQEQVIALLVVADQYGLNPFTREIFAFPDQSGGVVPVVGIDGWNRIAQQHEQFDGIEFNYSEDMTTPTGGKECPEWIEVVVYRKDRKHPVIVREYLDETFRPTGPWKTHTKRMLRHKALIQGYRIGFGFHGIYDPDEAEAFIDIEGSPVVPGSLAPPAPNFGTQSPEKPGKDLSEQEGEAPLTEEAEAPGEAAEASEGKEDELGLG